jgi:uncharacterized protein (TIGR02453 family)
MPGKRTTSAASSATGAHLRSESLKFLRALIRANRRDPVEAREWFQAHKAEWESELKQPMLRIIAEVTTAMESFAPEHVRPPEKSFFRIYRDTRFSADKRPYKEHVAAWWSHRKLEKTSGAGFYFHVSPSELIVAAGAYMPGKEQLAAIRNWLAEHHREFRALLEVPGLRGTFEEFEGNALTRPPAGFGADHPALDLLRCRQWGLSCTLPVEVALQPGFSAEIVRRFRLAAPVVAALNKAILAPAAEPTMDRRRVLFGFGDGQKPAKAAKNR